MFADLFDFTSEKELDEALLFYFVYFVIGYYLLVSYGFFLDSPRVPEVFVSMFAILPSIFCASISILSMFKKRLNDSESIFHLVTAVIAPIVGSNLVAVFLPQYAPFVGLALGILPATILAAKDNNNLYVVDARQKKEVLEQKIRLEKQLLRENAIRLKNKELNKIAPKDYASF